MKQVVVRKSRTHGHGVFAARRLEKGEVVTDLHFARNPNYGGFNHGCRPNAISVEVGISRLIIITRTVREGSEITLDYQRTRGWKKGLFRFKCRCPACREKNR